MIAPDGSTGYGYRPVEPEGSFDQKGSLHDVKTFSIESVIHLSLISFLRSR
jgi:hypothetical protein